MSASRENYVDKASSWRSKDNQNRSPSCDYFWSKENQARTPSRSPFSRSPSSRRPSSGFNWRPKPNNQDIDDFLSNTKVIFVGKPFLLDIAKLFQRILKEMDDELNADGIGEIFKWGGRKGTEPQSPGKPLRYNSTQTQKKPRPTT